jgi:dGTPase
LRVVTALERRYPDFDGLNLTWETLEGLVKHNGPLTDRGGAPLERYRARGVPATIIDYGRLQDLQLWSFAGVEAQIAAVADDIAYDAHDIDDGLRAGLFGLDDIAAVALPGKIIGEIRAAHPGLDDHRLAHELIRQLIGLLIDDVVAETSRRLALLAPRSADDVRRAASPVAGFSPTTGEADRAIKSFLKTHMYRHARVMRVMDQAAGVVRDLFARYSAEPNDLPPEWQEGLAGLDEASRARCIADFIAGMTDRYALAEHERLFDLTPELR